MRTPRTAAVLLPLMLLALGCAPQASSTATDTSSTPANQTPAECAQGKTLKPGVLTVGTDSPAYDPWFRHNDPTNGQGYESAVAYAVAKQLGFATSAVTWTKVPFNASYAPGPKHFDFDINQISITKAREQAVSFSDGYYTAAQALVALKGSPVSKATSLADLKKFKLGAQTGTTSLTALRDDVKPDSDPVVFQNTNDAKQALLNHQVDAIAADLPTAFYIAAAQIQGSVIVGQFQQTTGTPEQFGMLFKKDSSLVSCVNEALANLKGDGTLAALEKKWLSNTVNVPVLK
ncbi:MAG TPA: ABC transporter substrate-binding protein [Nocardioides sp.]|uniref:ABC transporter substrate-binding protein n=1 Tax=Nocardioides sp. TaxID=35761 RepID=UPI002E33A550|nr:ABC transporter substrate-binding protein [Nocardioides sp.]HEX3930257.1 ABC transporter substrate-binding protein [Nocardioides sp.]